MGIGLPELVIVLVILLLLFGASRLPKLSRSAGESLGEFKKGIGEVKDLKNKKVTLDGLTSDSKSKSNNKS